jgi:hypothetical protein
MLVSEVKEKMTSAEYVGWNLYFAELNERQAENDSGSKKSKNLMQGDVNSLVGALT